ncbi:hypothetical protein [Bordetella genomosp. 13]|uniref:hypothetical protein n=1 Tax=Bordetella genomosp. 13 TaxID=463040 RepID=UPI0021B647FA|nr:hypothetical protein [Bordetella genomosp. 13]
MYTRQPIVTPTVVGAVLCVQSWLDMTTQDGLREFGKAHDVLIDSLRSAGSTLPRNAAAGPHDTDILLRQLDNAVFTYLHGVRDAVPQLRPYQAVRGAFPQGAPLAENSGFRRDTHIQIALRDDTCVLGWFLPAGVQLMTGDQYRQAVQALQTAKARPIERKPRVRASSAEQSGAAIRPGESKR